jgi:sugar/nucleoside kinase (ribokinase family)
MSEVYAYGMTLLSTIHRLKGSFPGADGYAEISQTYVIPGGEAANAAVVLSHLGVSVQLDGCYLGRGTKDALRTYLEERGVDCSMLVVTDDFEGWRDMVFCDGEARTIFGWFAALLSGQRRLWSEPSEEAIRAAQCVAIDPFFGAQSQKAGELCVKHGRDYVTIDCPWDEALAQGAGAVVCSREFLAGRYPQAQPEELLAEYRRVCGGLVVFTFGGREVLYASPRTDGVRSLQAYRVKVVDTLAAGDVFRAGVVYGVLKGMPDDQTVRFASACAAVSCTRFPSVYEPPGMQEILELMDR